MIVPLLVALAIGVAIAFQAMAVSGLADEVHPLAISLALLVSGTAVASVWALVRGGWPQTLVVAGRWWWLPLGVVGWGIVAALGWSVARLGVATALAVIVGSQLVTGLAADAIRGAGTVGWRHLLGVTLLVAGAVLVSTAAPDRSAV